ncbi:hypothetical protein PS15m_004897 [Mucor circinelloides]
MYLHLVLIYITLLSLAQGGLIFDSHSEILDLHNALREKHNSPELKWSIKLAIESRLFVDGCDFYKTVNHKNSTNNIAQGYANWNDTILGWYSGRKYYNKPRYVSKAGPFIAMIWKSSTHVGCASFSCGKDIGRLYQCEYSPSIPVELVFDENEYIDNIDE